jgi:hypothetical protein
VLPEQRPARASLPMVPSPMAMPRANLVRAEERGVLGHRARARPAATTMSTLGWARDAAYTEWPRGGASESVVQQVGFELLYCTVRTNIDMARHGRCRCRCQRAGFAFPESERSMQHQTQHEHKHEHKHIKAPQTRHLPHLYGPKSRTIIASSTIAPAREAPERETARGPGGRRARSRLGKPPQAGHDDRA